MAQSVFLIALLLIACAFPASAQTFCHRAFASRRCPSPPTVDDFNVEQYLGKWYEIGSTASFKLLMESGLVCDQAVYNTTRAGGLSLTNSGLRVISEAAMAEVTAINVAASGVCSAARAVCQQLAHVGRVGGSLLNLSDSASHLNGLSQQLTSSVRVALRALDSLSQDVSLIQQANGQISQAGPSSLQASVADIDQSVREAGQERQMISSLATTLGKAILQVKKARRQSGWSESSKAALQKVSLSLASVGLEVTASSAAVELGLKAVGASASSLARNGKPVKGDQVSVVTGSITQPDPATSPAKLAVTIRVANAPYWVIALEKSSEGAYTAALVYSCEEVDGKATGESLFVLSREPQLPKATLDAFLAKAESLGIYSDCENPFLLTVQRDGACGQP